MLMREMVPPSSKLENYFDWSTLNLSCLVWSSSMLEFKNKGAQVELWVLNDALFISISQLKSAEYSPKMCSTQETPGWCHLGNRSNTEVDARIREDVMRSRVTFCTFISHPSSSGKSPILFLRPRGFPWPLLSSWDCPLSQRDDKSHVA